MKNNMKIYTSIWVIAIFILLISFFQNIGDAKTINYSGIIRGATQKLIKKELYGHQDDELINYLDDILDELQLGDGKYGLIKMDDESYQNQLQDMNVLWDDIKVEIYNVREGGSKERLYDLSENYFEKANKMVATAEALSNQKMMISIVIFVLYLILTISVFLFWYRYKQKQLDKAKYIDDLTGIYNYQAFEKEIEQRLLIKSRGYVMICFDIDDFKFLNTTYGYQFGDRLLVVFAHELQKFAGDDGCCARYGNDQFFVLKNDGDDIIDVLIHNLKHSINENLDLEISDDMTISVGAYKIQEHDSMQDCIDNSSLAHKEAKKKGKGMTVWYDQALLNKLYKENKLVKRMHNALLNHEFKMYLQPKFNIPSLRTVGAEALVRWHMDEDTVLYPDEFISLFEQNGFIYDLDFYMLEQVCQFIKENHLEDTQFRISINFSRVSIHHKDFYSRLTHMIDEYCIPIQCLELEITESAFNEFSNFTMNTLNKLHQKGYVLSMDDFGSGYSSLNILNKIPVDIIKIDKEFLKKKNRSRNMIAVIECIVRVSHALGMYVICEGVETKSDVDLLNELDCHLGQGYYVSRPVKKEIFIERFLNKEIDRNQN